MNVGTPTTQPTVEFLNLSQQSVASFMKAHFQIPWHQTVVAKIESGERQVKLAEALALAFVYGLRLDDLVLGLNLESNARLWDIDDREWSRGEHPEKG